MRRFIARQLITQSTISAASPSIVAWTNADERDKTEIAKAVGGMKREDQVARIGCERAHVVFNPAVCADVELIRLLRELRNARELFFTNEMYFVLDVERMQIVVERKTRGLFAAQRLRLVVCGSHAVFVSHCGSGRMEIEREVRRERSDCNLGKRRAHLRTVAGIVVDEHERVDADVKLARDIGEIERLRIPVDAHRGKVVFVKNSAGATSSGLFFDSATRTTPRSLSKSASR